MNELSFSRFETVSFLDLNPQLLFSGRTDTKFLFHYTGLEDLLASIGDDYAVMENKGVVLQDYTTHYFDTPDLAFYLSHHNQHGNRKKMRIRNYSDGSSFFVIKEKTNKGITLKQRTLSSVPLVSGLEHQIEVRYQRITFYSKSFNEKLTLDLELSFKKGDLELRCDEFIVAESKRVNGQYSPFVKLMRDKRISKSSFSKYCYGMAILTPGLKINNFKYMIQKTHKLKNDYAVSTTNW